MGNASKCTTKKKKVQQPSQKLKLEEVSNALVPFKKPNNSPKANENNTENREESAADKEKFEKLAKILCLFKEMGCHIGVTCDSCGNSNFKGYRYKCLECPDYDLCDFCFEKKKMNKLHLISHAMLLLHNPTYGSNLEKLVQAGLKLVNKLLIEKKIIHQNINCNGCDQQNISGIRFKCDNCLDFDLCYNCFSSKKECKAHKSSHQMISILSPLNLNISFEELQFEEKLGSGSFGEVYKAKWNNKKRSFISFEKEIKIYQELFSKNIIKYIGECSNVDFKMNTMGDAKDLKIKRIICLEFMDNGTLWENFYIKKKKFSLRKRFNWCLSLCSGLRRIHSKEIVHKDLKPDNIFLDNEFDLKIGDLGLAFNQEFANELASVQQIIYYPLEKTTIKSDIYSMGLIFNELFTGVMHKREVFYEIEPPSKYFFEIISKCLEKDPEKRPSAEMIEEYFLKFDSFFWRFIKEKKISYLKNTPDDQKNNIFDEIYSRFEKKFGKFL